MPWNTSLRLHWRPHALPAEMRGFFVHNFFLKTADSLLMIATPIALFEFGASLPFVTYFFSNNLQIGLFPILLFFIISRSTAIILAKFLSQVFHYLGMAHTMVVGQLLLIASMMLFPFIPQAPSLFFVAAILRGIGIFLYWVGSSTYFGSVAIPKRLGEEVGALEFLSNLTRITAPLITAFLIIRFGYLSAFLTGAAAATTAALLLFTIPNFHTKLKWKWADFFSALRQRDYRTMAIGMAGYAWEEVGINLIWPVLLFVTFGRISTVSYILSGATLISLLLVYLSGVVFDSRKFSHRMQNLAGAAVGFLWLPRAFFLQLPVSLIITESLDRLMAGVYGTLFYATLFSRARDKDVFTFYVNREIVLSLTLVGGFSLGVLMLFIHWNWTVVLLSFLLGALISLRVHRTDLKTASDGTL